MKRISVSFAVISLLFLAVLVPPGLGDGTTGAVVEGAVSPMTTLNVSEKYSLAEKYKNQAIDYIVDGNYSQALILEEQAIAILPDYANAWNDEVGIYLNMKQYDKALLAAENATKYDETMQMAWYNKALAYKFLGNYTGALSASTKALSIDANYTKASNLQGWALNGLGRYSDALSPLGNATEESPSFSDAWINTAVAYNGLKQYDSGLTAAEKAVSLDSQNADAWYINGTILKNLGRTAEANDALAKAKELNPNVTARDQPTSKSPLSLPVTFGALGIGAVLALGVVSRMKKDN